MTDTASNTRSTIALGLCLVGPMIWAAHLTLLYGAHTLICARLPGASHQELWLVVLSAVTAPALLGLGIFSLFPGMALRRRHDDSSAPQFLRRVTLLLSTLSALGIIWATVSAIMLPTCR